MSVETTRATMQAYWSGREEESLADDAVFVDMADGSEARGRDAIEQLLEFFYHHAFDATFEPTSTIIGDNLAVAEGYFTGTHLEEFAGIETTGRRVRVPICIVYELGEGLIRRARIYHVTNALINALEAQT